MTESCNPCGINQDVLLMVTPTRILSRHRAESHTAEAAGALRAGAGPVAGRGQGPGALRGGAGLARRSAVAFSGCTLPRKAVGDALVLRAPCLPLAVPSLIRAARGTDSVGSMGRGGGTR